MPSFDVLRFCNLLKDRTLLFLGDSTSQQAAVALINTVHFEFLLANRELIPAGVTDCSPSIHYALADTLVKAPIGMNRGRHWVEYATLLRSDVVILSAGPHIPDMSDFMRIVHQVVSEHSLLVPFTKLVWRSQFPGGCGPSPLSVTPDATYWKHYNASPIYNYHEAPERDRFARVLFDNISAGRAFLDLSPLLLRPDGHVGSWEGSVHKGDCLHMCLPGALFPLLGQSVLRILEEVLAQ